VTTSATETSAWSGRAVVDATAADVPSQLPAVGDLAAVRGTSGSDVWAVGNDGAIFHWNGMAWSRAKSGTTQNLSGVWSGGADNKVWVVGVDDLILSR
jgi:hypothetical protein